MPCPAVLGHFAKEEFLGLTGRMLKDTDAEEELIEDFKVFDLVGHGFVSEAEFRHVMTNLDEGLTDEEVDDRIWSMNVDDDSQINHEKLIKMELASE